MRVLVLALALTLCGCGTTPLVQVPRPKPVEAMVPCQIQLCMLRPEIVNLELQDQLAMILACKLADAEAYRRCSLKHSALVEHIEKE